MEALQVYDDGDIDSSLMMYTFLAELGMEVAQSNAAFLLEQGEYDSIGPFISFVWSTQLVTVVYCMHYMSSTVFSL